MADGTHTLGAADHYCTRGIYLSGAELPIRCGNAA